MKKFTLPAEKVGELHTGGLLGCSETFRPFFARHNAAPQKEKESNTLHLGASNTPSRPRTTRQVHRGDKAVVGARVFARRGYSSLFFVKRMGWSGTTDSVGTAAVSRHPKEDVMMMLRFAHRVSATHHPRKSITAPTRHRLC